MVPPPPGGLREGERVIRKLPYGMTAATTIAVLQEEHTRSVLSQLCHPLTKECELDKSKDVHKEDRNQGIVRMLAMLKMIKEKETPP